MSKLLLIGAGLAGLYFLSRGVSKDGSGGSGGGSGTERPTEDKGDTVINFPELDLSSIWGDDGTFEPKKSPADTWEAGVDYMDVETKDLGDYFRSQPSIKSNVINPRTTPPTKSDWEPKKVFTQAHHTYSEISPLGRGFTPRSNSGSPAVTPNTFMAMHRANMTALAKKRAL